MEKYRFTRLSLFLTAPLAGALLAAGPSRAEAASVPSGTADRTPKAVVLKAGETEGRVSAQELSGWFDARSRLVFRPFRRAEVEDIRSCPVPDGFCDFALSRRTRLSLSRETTFGINEAAVRQSLEDFAKTAEKDPVDAKFTIDGGKVTAFGSSQEGLRIDREKGMETIVRSLSDESRDAARTVELPVVTVQPAVRTSDAERLGIVELLGEGRTNFAGSPKNRVHNFKRAMEQFNGVIIPPRSEFSFVKLLGPVDGEHGYLPELVIKQNRTEPEFGGGVCQVSSTIFRAAVYSGLEITARRNHAYPVKYYLPYGMDATIYVPKPDLKFVNNTPGHILAQGSIEGSELIFRFYGTSDGRKVEVDGPHVTESHPDGAMKTVFTQKVTDAQGNVMIEDSFRSNYASPSKYPHPGEETVLDKKPSNWSEKQWSEYLKARGTR
jgi:vancomycin resistance protein YoaR